MPRKLFPHIISPQLPAPSSNQFFSSPPPPPTFQFLPHIPTRWALHRINSRLADLAPTLIDAANDYANRTDIENKHTVYSRLLSLHFTASSEQFLLCPLRLPCCPGPCDQASGQCCLGNRSGESNSCGACLEIIGRVSLRHLPSEIVVRHSTGLRLGC